MIRLIGAEVRRLFSRRLVLLALIGLFLAVAAYQIIVNNELTPPSAAERAEAERNFTEYHQEWELNRTQWEEDCRASAPAGSDCTVPEPTLAEFLYSVPFPDAVRSMLSVAVFLPALVAYLVGASFVGAEFATGSIANWLTFIPRRGAVFMSKLVTVAGFSALITALAGFGGLLTAVVLARIHGVTATELDALTAMAGRGILAGIALGVVGYAVGLLTRHTAAAIGVLVGYLFVWFVRNGVLSQSTWAQQLTPWTPEANLNAILTGRHVYSVPHVLPGGDGFEMTYTEHSVSLTHGLVFWALLLAVFVVTALVVFRRRDVN